MFSRRHEARSGRPEVGGHVTGNRADNTKNRGRRTAQQQPADSLAPAADAAARITLSTNVTIHPSEP